MRKSWMITHSVLVLGLASVASPSLGDIPDLSKCYFVPQAGSLVSPLTGIDALRNFRLCPNNDGTQSLPNSARIKIVILDPSGTPVVGFPAADIVANWTGGTQAQGFSGSITDSIIANSQWNPGCPDLIVEPGVRGITADGPTDALGVTYMTFIGTAPGNPGVGVRDPNRKWGHYDTQILIYIGGLPIQGKLTEGAPLGSYLLELKNLDSVGGLGAVMNQGERVNSLDLSPVQAEVSNGTYNFWHDFDWNGVVNSLDLTFLSAHNNHNCTFPLNP